MTTCRIGTRTHPMIILNYFAWAVVFVTGSYIAVSGRQWPSSWFSWSCLVLMAICGFTMDSLLTVGIVNDKSPVATVMIYSQVVWALLVDIVVWHISPNIWAFVGVCLVVCSLSVLSLHKDFETDQSQIGPYQPLPSQTMLEELEDVET